MKINLAHSQQLVMSVTAMLYIVFIRKQSYLDIYNKQHARKRKKYRVFVGEQQKK